MVLTPSPLSVKPVNTPNWKPDQIRRRTTPRRQSWRCSPSRQATEGKNAAEITLPPPPICSDPYASSSCAPAVGCHGLDCVSRSRVRRTQRRHHQLSLAWLVASAAVATDSGGDWGRRRDGSSFSSASLHCRRIRARTLVGERARAEMQIRCSLKCLSGRLFAFPFVGVIDGDVACCW